jgi:RimJ/RimL family protein N-acetyltransferase
MNATTAIFTFKSLALTDLPLLFGWFCQQHVAQLWPEPKTWAEFETKWSEYYKRNHKFIAYLDDMPFAYIQYSHVTDEDRTKFHATPIPEPSIGCDLFIGDPNYLGKGYGTELIKQFIEYVKIYLEPTCKAILIDPASDNYRAIACYKKIGFEKVGTYVVPYGTIKGPGPIDLMIYFMQ